MVKLHTLNNKRRSKEYLENETSIRREWCQQRNAAKNWNIEDNNGKQTIHNTAKREKTNQVARLSPNGSDENLIKAPYNDNFIGTLAMISPDLMGNVGCEHDTARAIRNQRLHRLNCWVLRFACIWMSWCYWTRGMPCQHVGLNHDTSISDSSAWFELITFSFGLDQDDFKQQQQQHCLWRRGGLDVLVAARLKLQASNKIKTKQMRGLLIFQNLQIACKKDTCLFLWY